MNQSVRAQVIERRTYLRPLDENGTVFETPEQAWRRVIDHQKWLWERAQGQELDLVQKAELEELYELFMSRKVTVSGRTRWLGGTEISKTRESSQFNCSFGEVQTVHDVVDTIWLLLQGCGVGFTANIGVLNGFTTKIDKLEIIRSTKVLVKDANGIPVSDPALKGNPKNVETFNKKSGTWKIVVGDSAEAWAKFFGKLLAFKKRAKKLIVDFSEIRPAGYRLSGYGWISSGDAQIAKSVEGIFGVLNRSAGKLLTAIDILDIENHLGTILSSRRSAEIALYEFGGPEWEEFATAKKDNYMGFCRVAETPVRTGPGLSEGIVRTMTEGQSAAVWSSITTDGTEWHQIGTSEYVLASDVRKDRVHRQMSNNSLVFYQKPTRRQLKSVFKLIETAGGSEPGFINGQEARRRAPYFKGVNPCVTADTWVETDHGPTRVADLIDTPFVAMVNGMPYNASGFWKTGNKDVYRLRTTRGYEIKATGNHRILVETSRKQKKTGGYSVKHDWVELSKLQPGDKVVLDDRSWMNFSVDKKDFDKGWLLGEMVGDGGHNPEKYPSYVRFWGDTAKFMAEKAADIVKEHLTPAHQFKGAIYGLHHDTWQVGCKALDDLAKGLIEPQSKAGTDLLEMQSLSFISGFLRGLFDADGSVEGSLKKGLSVRVTQVDQERLKMVQRMLLRLGVASTIYFDRVDNHVKALPDGKYGLKDYQCNSLSTLVISKTNIEQFAVKVGFYDTDKQAKLHEVCSDRTRATYRERFTADVEDITHVGVEPVYDVTVDNTHRFVANGVIAHNCAEILLGDKSFCNLVETAVCRFNGDEAALHRAHYLVARANYRQTCVNLDDGVLQRTWHELNDFLRLCGVGVTGVIGWEHANDAEAWQEMRDVAHKGAYGMADELGMPRPKLVTTVKPSGTQTKVFGLVGDEIGEGVHKPLGRYIFNNVNFSKDDPLIKVLSNAGYFIMENPSDPSGRIVRLPVEFNNMPFDKVEKVIRGVPTVVEVNLESAVAQLDRYKLLQDNYVDHNCSVTISYGLDEVPDIIDWLLDNWTSYVGVSFIYRNDPTKTAADLGYAYLPQEVVDEETFRKYVATLLPVDLSGTDIDAMIQGEECTTGACPIR
jgi:hypothetical protein